MEFLPNPQLTFLGSSGIQNCGCVDSSKGSECKTTNLNSPRRALIDKTAIVYGQTPLGIQKKQLEQMAAEMNMDLEALCRAMVALSEHQQFHFLQNYYGKTNNYLAGFFEKFHSHNAEVAQVAESNCSNRKSKFSYKGNGSRSSHKIDTHKKYESTNQNGGRQQLIAQKTIASGNALTHRVNGDADSDAGIYQPARMDDVTRASSSPLDEELSPNELRKRNSNKPTATCSKLYNEYESVITSILFDKKDKQLRKIISSRPRPKISSTKHSSVLETLLFE